MCQNTGGIRQFNQTHKNHLAMRSLILAITSPLIESSPKLDQLASVGCNGSIRLFVGNNWSVSKCLVEQAVNVGANPQRQRMAISIRPIDEELSVDSLQTTASDCLIILLNNHHQLNHTSFERIIDWAVKNEILLTVLSCGSGSADCCNGAAFPKLMPRQSWRFLDGQEHPQANDSNLWQTLQCTQYHPVLSRRDLCDRHGSDGNGGLGTVQWEHYLRELAYKLGLADKYGA
jgi:hypothetical protein